MAPKRAIPWILRVARQPSFWALIALGFAIFLLGWVYQLNRDTQELSKENRATINTLRQHNREQAGVVDRLERFGFAVCALRDKVASDANRARAFLVAHPEGIAGISATDLRIGIINQQRTLAVLAPYLADCPHRRGR